MLFTFSGQLLSLGCADIQLLWLHNADVALVDMMMMIMTLMLLLIHVLDIPFSK